MYNQVSTRSGNVEISTGNVAMVQYRAAFELDQVRGGMANQVAQFLSAGSPAEDENGINLESNSISLHTDNNGEIKLEASVLSSVQDGAVDSHTTMRIRQNEIIAHSKMQAAKINYPSDLRKNKCC